MEYAWEEIIGVLESAAESFSGIQGIISPLTSLGGIASYILLGIAVMMMGQKLGLKNPWLSWIPYANSYAFGRIADQYRSADPAQAGKTGKNAKLLLILSIVQSVLVVPLLILAVLVIVLGVSEVAPVRMIVALTFIMLLVLVGVVAVAVTYSVFYYIAFYRITKLYMGRQYQLWFVIGLVLSLVGISIAIPVIMLILSGKEPFAAEKAWKDFWQQPTQAGDKEITGEQVISTMEEAVKKNIVEEYPKEPAVKTPENEGWIDTEAPADKQDSPDQNEKMF
ncbi:MAG: hypothetical protein E7487_06975 [Ruminococcaceae bacterium]|nr:hypothetical protein [Oscillospiraceae bacterium]